MTEVSAAPREKKFSFHNTKFPGAMLETTIIAVIPNKMVTFTLLHKGAVINALDMVKGRE
jgi:hypothetical protein